MPPAFVLSQDQTLKLTSPILARPKPNEKTERTDKSICPAHITETYVRDAQDKRSNPDRDPVPLIQQAKTRPTPAHPFQETDSQCQSAAAQRGQKLYVRNSMPTASGWRLHQEPYATPSLRGPRVIPRSRSGCQIIFMVLKNTSTFEITHCSIRLFRRYEDMAPGRSRGPSRKNINRRAGLAPKPRVMRLAGGCAKPVENRLPHP